MSDAVVQGAIGQSGYDPQVDLDQLLSGLPHAILALAPDNRIVFANTAAESFLSSSLAVLRRQRFDDVLAYGCPLLGLVDQVRATGGTLNEYGLELHVPRLLQPKLVDVHAAPFPDRSGLVIVMVQQRNMAQLIERQVVHRAATRTVSGMAAVLAHEIKNPLSGIRGAAQLLEPALNDEDRALTQLICAETDRIRDLVDRMEVFGDERPLVRQPVNIHDVLGHVRRLAETGFGRNVRIVEDYDPSLPPVEGHRDKLVQVFLNLLKNAVEATSAHPEEARIILTTAYRPGVRMSLPGSKARVALPLLIQIEDNGEGIPEHLRARIFDPFVTSKRNGAGLGLAVVAKIVADHGGVIECDSEPRRTLFRVLLPKYDGTGHLSAVETGQTEET